MAFAVEGHLRRGKTKAGKPEQTSSKMCQGPNYGTDQETRMSVSYLLNKSTGDDQKNLFPAVEASSSRGGPSKARSSGNGEAILTVTGLHDKGVMCERCDMAFANKVMVPT